jgi:hypothetical protein
MTSDSLKYNTANKTAYFIAPTIIISDSNKIFTSAGYYNTEFEFAKLAKDNSLLSGEQKLVGDYIFYDRNANIGEAFGNVVLIDTLKKIDIYGHQGVFFEKSGYSIFTKSPYVRVLTRKTDSLYILADTLYTQKDSILRHIESPIAKEENQKLRKEHFETLDSAANSSSEQSTHRQIIRILAYNNARSYNDNIQSYSDSLVYSDIDSTLRLYKTPFLWATAKNSQVSGDSIVLKFAKDNQLHQLDVFAAKPLSIAKPFDPDEVSEEYNQVLSQHITTYFKEDSKPREIVYTGPIQSIFYLGEEKQVGEDLTPKVWDKFGMNKTSSALDMKIGFGFSGEAERIVFIKNPRSIVYPMDSIPEKERFLEGFNWKIELKPKSYAAIKAPYLAKAPEYTGYHPKIEDFIAPELANILRRELGVYQEPNSAKPKKHQKEQKQKQKK